MTELEAQIKGMQGELAARECFTFSAALSDSPFALQPPWQPLLASQWPSTALLAN